MKNINALAFVASLVLLSACAQKSDEPATAVEAMKPAKDSMVMPATTSNDMARERYAAGWADYENTRNLAANKKFLAAAKADPSFAMAHLMAAVTANSTEGFVTSLNLASANKAGATRGEQLLIEAFESLLAGDAKAAIAATQELTKLHPDSPRAWVFLGGVYQNVSDSENSRAAFAKAIQLDPKHVPGHIDLGNSFLTQEPKDFAKAEEHFQHAVALTPNEPNPHDLLGDVHRAQGNLTAAYDDYTKAAELAPDLGSGLQQRGHVNSFLGNYEEARADYTQSAALEDARGSGFGPGFLVYRAFVSLHEGKHEDAIEELQAIADNTSGSSMEGANDVRIGALLNIAIIAIEDGNSAVAKAAIAEATEVGMQQAKDLNSDDLVEGTDAARAYFEGLLAARMGNSKGASEKAAEFEQIVADWTNPRKLERMHEILGMNAYYQKDYDGAVEHLSAGNQVSNMYAKYYLARANEQAGNADDAKRLYSELAVYNFNGPGYAMFRKDILARAGS